MKTFKFVLLAIVCCACSSQKVIDIDPTKGRFPGAAKAATVVLSKPIDLDAKKGLLLIPEDKFVLGMLGKIGYFDEIITFNGLEAAIIKGNLTDKIPTLNSRIGIHNAAKHYKPFLWMHFDTRRDGANSYRQMILTDPENMEDYFITETYLDVVWTGVNDQYNWYPMFNALIDYVEANSKSRKR